MFCVNVSQNSLDFLLPKKCARKCNQKKKKNKYEKDECFEKVFCADPLGVKTCLWEKQLEHLHVKCGKIANVPRKQFPNAGMKMKNAKMIEKKQNDTDKFHTTQIKKIKLRNCECCITYFGISRLRLPESPLTRNRGCEEKNFPM